MDTTKDEAFVALQARERFRGTPHLQRAMGARRGASPEELDRAEFKYVEAALKNWADETAARAGR